MCNKLLDMGNNLTAAASNPVTAAGLLIPCTKAAVPGQLVRAICALWAPQYPVLNPLWVGEWKSRS